MIRTLSFTALAALLLLHAPAYAQVGTAGAAPPTTSSEPAVPPAEAAPASPAPTPPPVEVPAAPAAPEATPAPPAPAAEVASGKVGAPADGKGQVVFFRKGQFSGAAVWYKIREGGVELGKLTNGVYFVQPATPGLHVYTAATESTDTLRLEIEAGETYYVEGGVTMGLLVGRPSLKPSDQVRFDSMSKKLKPAQTPATDQPTDVASAK